ncbi:hypothetical protein BKA07_002081 [Brevibacterium marinum]|uniref:Uncharacterized protein n=1 Tax=Brevibacterium marinum TaxID=418643 RepID=A0A846RYN1_9MICO|nr:hypothetical protein [Brevibacterium marinum]
MDNTGIAWKLFGRHHSDASFGWEDAQKILADSAIASASRAEERSPGGERIEVIRRQAPR